MTVEAAACNKYVTYSEIVQRLEAPPVFGQMDQSWVVVAITCSGVREGWRKTPSGELGFLLTEGRQ
jgi:hypothetical protein